MEDILIAKQPIINKFHQVYGYEILSRTNKKENSSNVTHSVDSDERLLFNLLSTFGMNELLGGKRAFLNCILENNSLDYFSLVSSKNISLEIQRISNDNEAEIILTSDKIKILKSMGYQISVGEFCFLPKYKSWIEHAEVIKIDTLKYDVDLSLAMVMRAKAINKMVVLEKIETPEVFNLFSKYEVDFFQGYHFCKPIIIGAKIAHPSAITLIKLINLVIQESDASKIEGLLKLDPILSFKLLRYISSCNISDGVKVNDFKSAINFLGYKNLLKWLSILFTMTEKNTVPNNMTKTALIRAKFIENVASEIKQSNQEIEESSFLVGFFSLLDSMFGIPLDMAIDSINISEDIRGAILYEKGLMSELLKMSLLMETNRVKEAEQIAESIGYKKEEMHSSYALALKLVSNISF